MVLFTERHGMRAPLEKTYTINGDMYSLLLKCCNRYQKNLTHLFTLTCNNYYKNEDYYNFDEKGFLTFIRIKIPSLFRDEDDGICAPQSDNEYDQYALLDFIEFFAQNIEDISKRWNHEDTEIIKQ